mgnify:CR=1 FL=1
MKTQKGTAGTVAKISVATLAIMNITAVVSLRGLKNALTDLINDYKNGSIMFDKNMNYEYYNMYKDFKESQEKSETF